MKKEIYGAAAKGNVEFLRFARVKDIESAAAAYSDADLLGLTSHGNNIIHVAALHGHLNFIMEALKSFQEASDRRKLICGTNSDGDTPLHFAARQRTQVISQHLIASYQQLIFPQGEEMDASRAPWRVQNKDGNTPLHVALMKGGRSIQVAVYLLEKGPEVAAITNNRKEAPLHLAVTYDQQGTEMSAIKMINTFNSHGAALTCRKSLLGQDSHSSSSGISSTSPASIGPENEDKSLSLVRLLLHKNSEVCCLCDIDGMTPLLRAAMNSNLPVVDAIIKDCPESIEVCDPKGKNILHYIRLPTSLDARKFLEKPEIPVLLIDQQDHDGNTPMHIAVMNHDFGMLKAMVECNADFAIKNKEGVSAQTLFDQFAITNKEGVFAQTQIESKSNKFHELADADKEQIVMDELMSNELYQQAGNGEWEALREKLEEVNSEKLFLSRLPDGSNIIHIAIYQFYKRHRSFGDVPYSNEERFVVDALKKFPILCCLTNNLGQTPLHLVEAHKIMRLQDIKEHFKDIKEHFKDIKEQGEVVPLPGLPPWKAKDVHGNTILHIALKCQNYEFAKYLIELDANLIGEVNHSKETPLHSLCRREYDGFWALKRWIVELLVRKDVSAVYSQDVEGFTPLFRAAQEDKEIAIEILKHCPQSIRLLDPHGRNFFHYLDLVVYGQKTKNEFSETIPREETKVLITQKDDKGNTPLDLAVQESRFATAGFILECFGDFRLRISTNEQTEKFLQTAQIPRWFQDFLRPHDPFTALVMSRSRSTYGVGKEVIKEYINPLGVVAALLATVTFTAAFTVPGGYKGDTGIPNLGKKAAFQVFMVSDVVGMCSSMMVLFCLLWFLTTLCEDLEEEEMLVDMTIILLRISFYATLVAFMTGVYVTTISNIPWLAIFTCVLCALLILLMRRRLIKGISFCMRVPHEIMNKNLSLSTVLRKVLYHIRSFCARSWKCLSFM